MRLIRELKSEINRLKGIIAAAKLEDSGLVEQNIHRKEEMVQHTSIRRDYALHNAQRRVLVQGH